MLYFTYEFRHDYILSNEIRKMFILKMAKKHEGYTFKTMHFNFFKKDCPHILSLKKLLDCVEILFEFSNFSTNFLGRVSIACCFFPLYQ